MDAVAVFSGQFASQPLAFAHLLDAAEDAGLALDLDSVEVICGGDPRKRLAHVFAEDTVSAIRRAQEGDDTLVLVFPDALIAGAGLFPATGLLRGLGSFAADRPRRRA